MPVSHSRRLAPRSAVSVAGALLALVVAAAPAGAVAPAGRSPSRALDSAGVARAPSGPVTTQATIGLATIKSGFSNPIFVTNAGDRRLFVVEQGGLVKVLRPPSGSLGWQTDATPFLDVRSLVLCCGEQGLLGLAFHPDYAANGRFFMYYTDRAGNNRVAEGHRDSRNRGHWTRTILVIPHPGESNHNGGMIAFGPDGYLYIGTGDGGGGGDQHNHAQTLSSLLGKLLRIDVDRGSPYGIPSSNPYAGSSGNARLVWSFGLRNPWRWSFDRANGDILIGDVGQEKWEEVDRTASGRGVNFGWHVMEGRHCYNPSSGCNTSGKAMPIAEYAHSVSGTDNCAIIGGYVYRGTAYPALRGRYVFADACSTRIWNISPTTTYSTLPSAFTSGKPVSAFGESNTGELYMVALNGAVYRVIAH